MPIHRIHDFAFAIILAFGVPGWLSAQEDGNQLVTTLKDAQVTIPYSELQRLWTEANQAEPEPEVPKPPIDSLVRSLDANVEILDHSVRLTAEISVESFGDEWSLIELLAVDAGLVDVEPQDARVIRREGAFSLLQEGAGTVDLKLTFERPRRIGGREQLLEIQPLEATSRVLSLSGIADGRSIEVNGVSHFPDALGSVAIPASATNEEKLSIALAASGAMDAQEAEVAPSIWRLSSQIVVHHEDGALHFEGRIFAQDESGDGSGMELALDGKAREVEFIGEGIHTGRPRRGEDDRQLYSLSWDANGTMDRAIDFSFTTPVSPLADSWRLSVPSATEEGSSAEALFVIPLSEGLEISGDGVQAEEESQRISQWFQQRIAASGFVSVQTDTNVAIEPRWAPRRTTAQATIAQATFQTQLEKNGQTLNQVAYHIEHDQPLTWRLQLPVDCEVLKCAVNGQQTAPIQRDDATAEFQLKPESSDEGDGSVVEITYAQRSEALDEVGGNSILTLPETNLFIHEISWALRIPDTYAVTAVDGDFEVASDLDTGGSNTLSLHKRLVQAEAPAIDLFYSRPTSTD